MLHAAVKRGLARYLHARPVHPHITIVTSRQFAAKAVTRLSWKHITDLKSLREYLSDGALLVAFDTESYAYRGQRSWGVSELGFATLQWPCPGLQMPVSYRVFAQQNNVKLLTIQTKERNQKGIERTSSPIVHSNGIEETKEAIRSFLPTVKKAIFVGYAANNELEWMEKNYPELTDYFVAFIDVQELLMQRCREETPSLFAILPGKISLSSALRGMNLAQNCRDHRSHRAANDACRFLQVLAGLLTYRPLTLASPYGHVWNSLYLQPHPSIRKKYSMRLAITASEGNVLPRRTAEELARMYHVFEPVAVGCYTGKKNGKYWWLAFGDQESLTKCVVAVDGSLLDGITLETKEESERVWELRRAQIRAKRLEARSVEAQSNMSI
ncbi:hypothetical protein DM02DRAFT_668504 [Periconia macrospinosa]|uniref:Uncharacterized protein n=1 Tax=Periconia macrospinosa TaxID=97972 RepID=A0A2V1E5A1_9PLEO|nr:hypothetical protein DM02DRAFT_668504 [Periconia macrospinosa]